MLERLWSFATIPGICECDAFRKADSRCGLGRAAKEAAHVKKKPNGTWQCPRKRSKSESFSEFNVEIIIRAFPYFNANLAWMLSMMLFVTQSEAVNS
jgi:hypothetical protein